MKENLLFYGAYENFYKMAANSEAFGEYCRNAFGEDFSQDGFSNLSQIELIMSYIPAGGNIHILDVGCGNGKMLRYIQRKKGCFIHGFDYSENAISQAVSDSGERAEFRVGIIGETEYPESSFDAVISMDSVYFAKNMTEFAGQVNRWLKDGGIFLIGYQEGDVMPKTENSETAAIASALDKNNMQCKVIDITDDTYYLLKKKREIVRKFKKKFKNGGILDWYNVVLHQTDCVKVSLKKYRKNNARYIYIAEKSK